MTEQQFFEQMDAILEEGHLLKHPFYRLWNEGGLTREMLQNYARQYYHLVHRFPTFVSATHAACDDLDIRRMLLENLVEEEGGDVHHPELWLRFVDSLEADRTPLTEGELLPETAQSVKKLRQLSRSEHPEVGLAALYAYEAQIPAVATTKIEGLTRFYGVTSDEGLSFFRVHQKADRVHSAVTRAAMKKLCSDAPSRERALGAAAEATRSLNLLLDGVYSAYCEASAHRS